MTQSAISKHIAALEKEFNTRLFNRIGKLNILTEAGEALLANTRRILSAVENSHRIIANMSQRISGKLRLGISHHIGLHRLPPVLREYTRLLPAIMQSSDLKITPIESLKLKRQLGVVLHRDRTPSHAATALLKLLEQPGSIHS